jgi:CRISPR/Cas system CSM-associated protein Csm2 small subunit
MAKEKEDRLKKVLEDMSYSLNHIEDIMADDRALLVKLVKQNNSIVDFLKQIQIDDVTTEYEDMLQPPLSEEEEQKIQRFENLKEVLEEFMDKRQDLIEFEKELKKHKDQLTPGQVGDS